MSFLGEFKHSLDDKGRLVLPAKFRDRLSTAVVSSHRDSCLALWTPEQFKEESKTMSARMKGNLKDRSMARVFFASAQEVAPDRQGRVVIPTNLREMARLTPDCEVVVTGAWDWVEVWLAESWISQRQVGVAAMAEDD